MKLTFLRASDGTPLTKTFRLDEQANLVKEPYPHIARFTSKTVEVNGLRDYYDRLRYYASNGWCLLKGEIQKELVNESRAGSTAPDTPTWHLLLDFDGVPGITTSKQALKLIGLPSVNHIVQISSSMGVQDDLFRSHIIATISAPVTPGQIKNWITWINLTVPELREAITLTRSQNALRWPLDISVNQNDKLIYIAPPIFEDMIEDPYPKNRIRLLKGTNEHVPAALFRDIDSEELDKLKVQRMNELRKEAGLPLKRKLQTKMHRGQVVGSAPVQATVTGIKEDRGFVYLNLNGGDSWAYYFPLANPEVLHNFKGEQSYALKDIAPELYEEYVQKSREWLVEQNERMLTERKTGRSYLAFLEKTSDTYYRGFYDHDLDDLQISPTNSLVKLQHFLKQHGQPVGDFIPEWDFVFDFGNDIIFNPEQRTINLYKRTDYLRHPRKGSHPTIDSLIRHVTGDDPKAFSYFMNWLAYIIKERKPARTAWLMYGVQGTGKGVLFNHVLSPLVGRDYVAVKRLDEIEQDYNGWMRHNLLLLIDEAQATDARHLSRAMAKINNFIVEPTISIRAMRTDAYMVENHMNVMIASNKPDPLEIVPTDRRINVAKFQPNKLRPTKQFINNLKEELYAFAYTLLNYDVSEHDARNPMESEDKDKIKYLTRNSIDLFADAINSGDLRYFFDALPTEEITQFHELNVTADVRQAKYRHLMTEFFAAVTDSKNGKATVQITRDNLQFMASYMLDRIPTSPNKFTSFMKYHDVMIGPIKVNKRTVQGVTVEFSAEKELIDEWNEFWLDSKSTPKNVHHIRESKK